ncbi:MAG TPA: hypothetical protein VMV94_18935 [Phycisphaerae bacterium]|nr:hypothetical protein [Phycisphaerae bacterium]
MKRVLGVGASAAGVAACLLAAGCGAPVLTVEDALAAPDGTVRLVAYVEREAPLNLRKDVDHVTVTFFLDGREIGREKVNGKGRATIKWQLPSPDVSRFSACTTADGQKLEAAGEIYRWRTDRVIIAVDIDGTLSRTEYKDLILKKEDDESDPVKGARATVCRLAEDYHILYFTARPRILLTKTRTWLHEHGFPPAPLMMAPGLKQMMQPTEYKRRALAALRKEWPNLLIGIGNKKGDAEAYSASGMLSLIVRETLEKDVGIYAIHVRDWKALGKFLAANRAALTDPKQLNEVIKGEGMLLQAVQPWQRG